MSVIAGILKAVLQGVLAFIGERLDRRAADDALRELGAREAEGKWHENFEHIARQAAERRADPAADDGELDRRLRAPADRDRQPGA